MMGSRIENSGDRVLEKELIDRFGPLPKQAQWLLAFSRIRVFASTHQFVSLKFDKITVHAKRQLGKKELEKKIFLPLIDDPEEFEFITIGFLRRDFSI